MDPLQPMEASRAPCSITSAFQVEKGTNEYDNDSDGLLHGSVWSVDDNQRPMDLRALPQTPGTGTLRKAGPQKGLFDRRSMLPHYDAADSVRSAGELEQDLPSNNGSEQSAFSNGDSASLPWSMPSCYRTSLAADPTDDHYDPRYMMMALHIGKQAMAQHAEVPVGCLLVQRYTGSIIGRGANRCNELRNATKHAELVSLADVASRYPDSETRDAILVKCDVYVTCEPCIMCTAALITNGIGGTIYFGCRNERFGGCGTVLCVHDGSCGLPTGRKPLRVSGGHFARESIALLHRFYEMENMFAPEEKRKVKRSRMKEQAHSQSPCQDEPRER
jgi:tRNA-specific adenosine deaminase 2